METALRIYFGICCVSFSKKRELEARFDSTGGVSDSRRVNFVRGRHLIMKSGKILIKCVNVNIQCVHIHFGSRPKSNSYAGGGGGGCENKW